MNVIILVTTKDKDEAEKIASYLLKKKLIACANIIDKVESHFWWNNAIDSANETLLILKTIQDNFEDIEREVKLHHSYDVPEIIVLPIIDGSKEYLDWIKDATDTGC